MSNVFIKLTVPATGNALFVDRRNIDAFTGPGSGPTELTCSSGNEFWRASVKETPNRVLKLITESEDAFDASL